MNNQSKTQFIALDLEMEQPSGEIIQVGIAWEAETGEIQKKNFYITPSEPVSEFIKNLCNISDSDFDWSKSREQCYDEFLTFLITVVNPQTHKEFVVWGQGDLPSLARSLRDEGVWMGAMSARRVIDVKTICAFNDLVHRGRAMSKMSLKTALKRHGICEEGVAHQAADDAYNTLRLFHSILQKQVMVIDSIDKAYKYSRNT